LLPLYIFGLSVPAVLAQPLNTIVVARTPADAQAAGQLESALWLTLSKLGAFSPVTFVVAPQSSAEAFATQLAAAVEFLKADKAAKRNPETLALASELYFAAKQSLGERTAGEVARATALLGAAMARDEQRDLAKDYLLTAHYADAQSLVELERWAPDLAPLLTEVRSAAELAVLVDVALASSPPGASAIVDGAPAVVTPGTTRLKAGTHLVQLTLVGHFPTGWFVDTKAAGAARKLELKAHPSWSRYVAARDGAAAAASKRAQPSAGHLRDLLELSRAQGALVLSVAATADGYDLAGGWWSGSAWKSIDGVLTKDVTILEKLESLLRAAAPAPAPSPKAP
jgi:hypothetical protein